MKTLARTVQKAVLPLAACLLGAEVTGVAADPGAGGAQEGRKVLNMPLRVAGPNSLDPVYGSTVYDNHACCLVYETLVQFKYLVRPSELEPLLLTKMPESKDGGTTWDFELRQGVRFHDDPCFPGGKGRELKADDVFYSWKRMADEKNQARCWWLFADTIVGFDEYKAAQNAAAKAGGQFDYDAPVEGFKKLDDYRFQVVLKEPVYRFIWVLSMFQTSVVPREACEMYGTRFGRHPVGTGAFTMREEDWIENKSMTFQKNPNYHDEFYPSEHMPEDLPFGFQEPAGKKLPFLDTVKFTFFVQDQPMWLEFKAGSMDYTQVPAENYDEAIHKPSRRERRSGRGAGTLKQEFADLGIVKHDVPLLDFIFRGFNMEDQLLGGYTKEKTALRKALVLAMDFQEYNDTFYNSINVVYDGMIPPGLDGYPEGGISDVSLMGPDLERSRKFLVEAGYPNAEGLPTIEYYVSNSSNSAEQAELMKRQLGKVGINLNVRIVSFPQLMEVVNNKRAAMFSFAWSSDYPDGENNLALFYGPNEAPGSNHFNYKKKAFDALYEQIRTMAPSPDRTALYVKMRDMVIDDAPFAGSMARTRIYLVQPWLKNFKPSEDFYNWPKYLDIDDTKRSL